MGGREVGWRALATSFQQIWAADTNSRKRYKFGHLHRPDRSVCVCVCGWVGMSFEELHTHGPEAPACVHFCPKNVGAGLLSSLCGSDQICNGSRKFRRTTKFVGKWKIWEGRPRYETRRNSTKLCITDEPLITFLITCPHLALSRSSSCLALASPSSRPPLALLSPSSRSIWLA